MDLTPALKGLTDQDRIFVEGLLRGLSQVAAATAAGYKSPARMGTRKAQEPHIVAALEEGRRISAQATGITREKLNDMLMSAYYNAATSGEQVSAVMALAKINGLIEQKSTVSVQHSIEAPKHEADLKRLPTAELMRLAQMSPDVVIEGTFVDVTPRHAKN